MAPRELTTNFAFTSAQLVVTACWPGSPGGAEAAVAPFGSLAFPVTGSFENMAWGQRHYSKGGFLGKIDDAAIACMKGAIASAPTADSDIYVLQLGGAINDIEDNATPYSGRAADYYWIANTVSDERADDARCIDRGRKVAKSLTAISMQGNYVNEQADFGTEVAFNAYGMEKYNRLAKLKARCDPTNLFRLN
jgi:Berberine and berberine like